MEIIFPIFTLGCCFVIIMVIAVIISVKYSRKTEGAKVSAIIQQLKAQMRLTPLDPTRPHRFGGAHQGHAYYIDLGSTGLISSRSVSIHEAIAVSLEVQMREPRQGYAYCNRGLVGSTSTFDAAFSAKLKYEWLSNPARESMLTFVRKRQNLFLEGLPLHPKPQVESDSKVRLQHNIPNNKQTTPDQILVLLDELLETAYIIETTC